MTKQDLIDLGYGAYLASDIIKQAKQVLVDQGYQYYDSRKLSRVPIETVEAILGIQFPSQSVVD